VIICSGNVLSEEQVLATLRLEGAARPRAPWQAYRCLGCAPRCGRCIETVRALLASVNMEACNVGCATCPAGDDHHRPEHGVEEAPFLIAAE
jgi:bacterioferritin-associated ferredoxin